ncbi:MAG: DUF3553 domain-containing protein [Thermodesulfobacteriota bacterium]
MKETRRLYLAVGNTVIHKQRPEWGVGRVIEEMNSTLPGGLSMIRIEFEDGVLRAFNNDVDSEHFCYHAGIRKHS